MLQNFNKVVPREALIMGAQQIEEIFNTVRTNLRAWLHIHWVWGQSRGMTAIRFNSAVNRPGFGSLVYRHD